MVRELWVLTVLLLVASSSTEAQVLTDPMRPSGYRPGQEQMVQQTVRQVRDELKLTAVLTSGERLVAVINGQILQPGQLISGYRLTEIRDDRVVLKKDDQIIELFRLTDSVRKVPSQ